MSFLKKCDLVFSKAVQYFCSFLFACLILDVFVAVVFRYVLNNPITWSEEAARFLSIWMILVGSSMTIRVDEHTCIDFVQMLFKNPTAKMVWYIITRIVAAVSMLVLFPYTLQLMNTMGTVISGSLRIPMKFVYLAFPVGIICMLIAWIVSIPKFSKELKTEAEKELIKNQEGEER